MPWEQNIHSGNLSLASGLYEQAFQRFTQALKEGKAFAQADALWGDAQRGLSRAAIALGRYEEAEKAAEAALETDRLFWGELCPQVAEDYYLLGEACRTLEKFESAKPAYSKALEYWFVQGGDVHEQSLLTLSAMLLLYLQSQREEGFAGLHARTFAAYQATNPVGMWMKFLRLEETLNRYFNEGKSELATEILNREISIMTSTLGRNHKELKPILEYHSRCLHDAKKYMAAWRISTQIGKTHDDGLFFSQTRNYQVSPEQVISIISNLLVTRGNFTPPNTPRLLHRQWWHVKKADPLAHKLNAVLELPPTSNRSIQGFMAPLEHGRLELEIRCGLHAGSTETIFEWRVHDYTNITAIKEVMNFTLTEFAETFKIMPNPIVRHLAVEVGQKDPWPSPQMYNEAIQNSHLAFPDEQLKYASPELNAIGLPRPLSGAFATVYRLSCAGKEWAVKCFTEPVKDQQERYAAISRALQVVKLPFFTEFNYLEKGIRVPGGVYPILKMSWVNGQTLNVALASNLGNREVLSKMSAAFVYMANAMESCGIAHGDLQHGNILVGHEGFTLVDYDCMYVPELQGKISNEIGHRNYQHPGRSAEHFGPYLDHFSVWVIYVSFFILARHPELWESLDCGDESLLFKQSDFVDPNQSKTFHLLKNHEDVDVRKAASSMLEFLQLRPQDVPSISSYFKQGIKH